MRVERRLAAIMAADVIGYSRLMGQDEEGTVRQIKALLQEVVRPAYAETRGRIVKTMGDGFLGEFPSVVDAFHCAVALQQAAGLRAIGVPVDDQIILRIGINVGEIITDDDGDVFGDGVNIAARLEGLAEAGAICVSQRAWEDLRRLKIEFTDLGEQQLKNIARPVRVFSYTPPALEPPKPEPKGRARRRPEPASPAPAALPHVAETAAEPAPPPRSPRQAATPSGPRMLLLAGGVAAVIAIAGGAVLLNRKPPPDPLTVVTAEVARTPCSWLRVSDHSSVDGQQIYKLSGASRLEPAALAGRIVAAAQAQKVDVHRVITTDVAPLNAQQCAWIEALKPFRYAGVPRFSLHLGEMRRGAARAEVTFDPQELGALGAVYGIEPSGVVQRIATRPEIARLGPPAVIIHPDGTRTLNFDTDQAGWNGVVFLQSATPTPEGPVETAPRTDADRQRFAQLAKAGGWRFELAWFHVER